MRITARLVPALVALTLVPELGSAAPGSGVVTTKKREEAPAAAPGWLAWTQTSLRGGPHVLYAKPSGGERFRVSPRGTEGFAGSIEGNRLIYSQIRRKGDLQFFDLSTRTHSDPPAGVNTSAHESIASFSGEWLLFRRSPGILRGQQTIILRNLTTNEERVLATADGRRRYAQPGTVNGNFVTWLVCRRSSCSVFRYEISTGATITVPNPKKRAQFAASGTSDGTVYFVEAARVNCGAGLALWRFTSSGKRQRLARLPSGGDVSKTSPVPENDGRTTVYFDLFDCRDEDFPADIRKITA